MKKCDLHIHTKTSVSDSDFVFSIDILKQYVSKMQIEVIAITNHNMFDATQFNDIVQKLTDVVVLPGIEINLSGGHLLLIANNSAIEISDFAKKCNKVSELIVNPTSELTLPQFQTIFPSLSKYLLIPHYDKEPKIPKTLIDTLSSDIFAGEVTSVKKFLYMLKEREERLSPVLFSDFRPSENYSHFPTKQTYLDIDDININSLRGCLMDKSKVHLTQEGNDKFPIFDDGFLLSTGLNIVLGKRSSGKSYTLTKIAEIFGEKAKYIKQFELLNTDSDGSNQFNDETRMAKESIVNNFFKDFADVLQDIVQVPSKEKDEDEITKYIKALKQCAEEQATNDVYSRTHLYNETTCYIPSHNIITDLIDSVLKLIESQNYQSIITRYVELLQLQSLLRDLITEYRVLQKQILIKRNVNKIIQAIKEALQLKSAAPIIPNIDFYKIALNKRKRQQFEIIAKAIKQPKVIHVEKVRNFTIKISTRPFRNATDMKFGKQVSLVDAFQKYESDSAFSYLTALKSSGVESTMYQKLFAKVDYEILNSSGFPVSGGERSEFNFMQKIKDSQLCDILIIDEPESSFDNIFLNEEINGFLKEMSLQMPVVISTHNSTIGGSIKPNYILYTEKKINGNDDIEFRLYGGNATALTLKTTNGHEIQNYLVTLNSLEAGRNAYLERRTIYETLNH